MGQTEDGDDHLRRTKLYSLACLQGARLGVEHRAGYRNSRSMIQDPPCCATGGKVPVELQSRGDSPVRGLDEAVAVLPAKSWALACPCGINNVTRELLLLCERAKDVPAAFRAWATISVQRLSSTVEQARNAVVSSCSRGRSKGTDQTCSGFQSSSVKLGHKSLPTGGRTWTLHRHRQHGSRLLTQCPLPAERRADSCVGARHAFPTSASERAARGLQPVGAFTRCTRIASGS